MVILVILPVFLANFLSYPTFQATSETKELQEDKDLAPAGHLSFSCPPPHPAFPSWLCPLTYFWLCLKQVVWNPDFLSCQHQRGELAKQFLQKQDERGHRKRPILEAPEPRLSVFSCLTLSRSLHFSCIHTSEIREWTKMFPKVSSSSEIQVFSYLSIREWQKYIQSKATEPHSTFTVPSVL